MNKKSNFVFIKASFSNAVASFLPRSTVANLYGQLLAGCLGIGVFMTGCQSKVEVRTTSAPIDRKGSNQPQNDPTGGGGPSGDPSSGGSTGKVEPLSIPGALSSTRSYFQTRSVVSLKIAPESVEPGDLFSLFNVSSNEELVEPRPLAFGPIDTGGEPFSLATSGVQVFVSLYLLNPEFAQKFTYGPNVLRLNIDSAQPKTDQKTIYLRDFKLLGTQTAHFSENKQRIGGFQGEISTLRRPILKAGPNIMTNGFLMMVNH
jgi:hypothetical protein